MAGANGSRTSGCWADIDYMWIRRLERERVWELSHTGSLSGTDMHVDLASEQVQFQKSMLKQEQGCYLGLARNEGMDPDGSRYMIPKLEQSPSSFSSFPANQRQGFCVCSLQGLDAKRMPDIKAL